MLNEKIIPKARMNEKLNNKKIIRTTRITINN